MMMEIILKIEKEKRKRKKSSILSYFVEKKVLMDKYMVIFMVR
jgi:hypothetical protein